MILSHNTPFFERRAKENRRNALLRFPYNNAEFQVDPDSLTLIAGRSLKITHCKLKNESISNQVWRTTSNEFMVFTPDEFLAFADAADEYVEQVYTESWQEIDGF